MDSPTQERPIEGPEDERERLLIEAVVTLARTLRDERDRLAERLQQVEQELASLAARLDGRGPDSAGLGA
jgi:hypothetical protein